MKHLLSVALALWILSLSTPVMAGSSPTSKVSTFIEYLNDVLSGTEKVEGEIEWTLKGEDYTIFTRLGNDWPFPFQEQDPEVLKRSIKFDMGDIDMTLGDFSIVLGRGIVLSAVEDRPLGYDSMLDGVRFDFRLENWKGSTFYGFHKTDDINDFPIGVGTLGDADLLWGGRLGYDFDDVDLGFHYLNSYIDSNFERYNDAFLGFDVEFKLGGWQFLYEHDFRDTFAGFDDGRAHYAEVSGGWPGMAVTFQYKDYLNMAYDYASPPRLRRGDLEEGSIHPDDERGYMATLVYSPECIGDSYFTGIFAASEDTARIFPFHEVYMEYQHDLIKDTTFSLGYDYVKGNLQVYNYLQAIYRDLIFELDHTMNDDSLHLHVRFTEIDGEVGDEEEKEIGIDYNVGSDLTLSLFYEASTFEFEPAPLSGDQFPGESPGKWFAFSAMYDIDPFTSLELVWGSRRGGYECSGGICIQKPPFRGIQVILHRIL